MNIPPSLLDLLIPSVAALVGAAAAFLLVILNDERRRYRQRKVLRRMIIMNKKLAEDKKQQYARNRELFVKKGLLIPSGLLPFPHQEIKRLQLEVLTILRDEEKLAQDSICYFMDATDNQIRRNVGWIEEVIKYDGSTDLDKQQLAASILGRVLDAYREVDVNLGRILNMLKLYEEKKYRDILDLEYIETAKK